MSTMKRWMVLALWAMLSIPMLVYSAQAAQNQLRLLVWEGYAEPDWVEEFEKKYDADVQVVYLSSDDEMWTKIKGSDGADFDLVSVSTSGVDKFVDNNLFKPIDITKIPNRANQLPQFQNIEKIVGATRDGKVYGVPFAFGSIGLIYDKDRVVPAPTSWSVLWDPKYKQKVIVSDTSEVGISMVALSLGIKSPYKLTDDQFTKVKARLSALRDNMLSYYSSSEESLQVYEAGSVDLIFTPWGEQAAGAFRKAGHNVGYAIPDEGASGWIDVWAMTKGVQNEELALAWLNFVLEKRISSELTTRFNLGNTVSESTDFDYASRLLWAEPVEDFTKRTDIWNAVKAGQ
ncbi:MAG TPA: extracellular solute-binding protein [Pararhizobium sp.]|uniref:ABC transporter substrate-binding protein n=1 Tax=Pararhizobium sp. TaxID=1977563 RepID=UPI002CA8819C|nr:extracellular solute-binding protein [Pararhizobium sp.]HTO33340.1 extracellular solute-binding protein [Pararhizobium sp.]